ncbi:MAG: PilZ domain-containing protein [Candidatus Sulfotelmatobacter sp.]
MENRRKDVRVPLQAQVTCIAESRTMRGVTRNISESGIQVELPELRKREKVQLGFRLSVSGSIVDATGAVIWIVGRRNGIKFKYMGEQSRMSIRQFIEDRKHVAS